MLSPGYMFDLHINVSHISTTLSFWFGATNLGLLETLDLIQSKENLMVFLFLFSLTHWCSINIVLFYFVGWKLVLKSTCTILTCFNFSSLKVILFFSSETQILCTCFFVLLCCKSVSIFLVSRKVWENLKSVVNPTVSVCFEVSQSSHFSFTLNFSNWFCLHLVRIPSTGHVQHVGGGGWG